MNEKDKKEKTGKRLTGQELMQIRKKFEKSFNEYIEKNKEVLASSVKR